MGVVLLEQGKPSQALAYLDKALELEPEHEQALLNSAILLQELGAADLRHLARQRLLKLLDKDGKEIPHGNIRIIWRLDIQDFSILSPFLIFTPVI